MAPTCDGAWHRGGREGLAGNELGADAMPLSCGIAY
jgi:hypothetical protein